MDLKGTWTQYFGNKRPVEALKQSHGHDTRPIRSVAFPIVRKSKVQIERIHETSPRSRRVKFSGSHFRLQLCTMQTLRTSCHCNMLGKAAEGTKADSETEWRIAQGPSTLWMPAMERHGMPLPFEFNRCCWRKPLEPGFSEA